jgi:hypothetical protein
MKASKVVNSVTLNRCFQAKALFSNKNTEIKDVPDVFDKF